MKLTISICRQNRHWAVFRGHFDLVKNFTPYETETQARVDAFRWCEEHGDKDPHVVYPRITRITTSTRYSR
jgi:hypothetical protein